MMLDSDTVALAVGIEKYDFGIPVPGASNAAVQFVKLLCERGVKPKQIYLRLSPNPPDDIPGVPRCVKRGNAKFRAMRDLLEGELPCVEGQMLCVFWAGHGAVDGSARRLYLADSKASAWTFDFEKLLWLLARRYNFAQQLIFVDACANDPGAFGMHKHGWGFGMESDPAAASREGQFALFAASRGQAAEFTEGNGVYSRELIRLLRADPPPQNVEALQELLHKHFKSAGTTQRPSYYYRWNGQGAEEWAPPVSSLDPPPLPVGYVERSKESGDLRSLVLRKAASAIAITAVSGMPGSGKSVLAKSLLSDPAIRDAYRDILWLTLGQDADPLRVMKDVTVALRAPWGNHLEITAGSSQVRRLLRDRNALIVLDDVWDPSQVLNFRTDGDVPSAILFTTRKGYVVSQTGAVELRLGQLTETQALQLLANRCQRPVGTLPAEAKSIVKECGNLALAVAISGTRLRSKPAASWRLVLQQLESADLERLGSLEDYEHKGVFRAIHVSVQDLPEIARTRYIDICVFPEDAVVPPAALQVLWAAAPEDALPTVEAWVDGGLAELDAEGRLTFHDLLLDYARRLCGDPLPVHKRLLANYGKLAGPDIPKHGLLASYGRLAGTSKQRFAAWPTDRACARG